MAAAQEAQKKLNDKLKIKDNVITYSAAVSACAKGSRPEEALQLLREMRRSGLQPNVITYNPAISACAKGSLEPSWNQAGTKAWMPQSTHGLHRVSKSPQDLISRLTMDAWLGSLRRNL